MTSATASDRYSTNSALLARIAEHSLSTLRGQARRHARLEADAEEALQSACAIFIEKFRPPAEPLPWLMTTIKREAWRLARRSHRHRELPLAAIHSAEGGAELDLTDAFPDDRRGPAELAEGREEVAHCAAHLDRLKSDERAALLLFGLGYSYAEIAELRGWTYTKVNRCINEGRSALRMIRDRC